MHRVCIFTGSRDGTTPRFAAMAREVGAAIARRGWGVVYGGASVGLMGAVADAALAAGGEVQGVIPESMVARELAHPRLSALFVTKTMHERKTKMHALSDAFLALPGGFGTLDECYELLTLLQTGKAEPAPVVLVETPGGNYWSRWREFVEELSTGPGYISADDLCLYRIVTTVEDAAREVLDFYRNYHSCRWVGDLLVLRLQVAPSQKELSELNKEFGDIVSAGSIRLASPFPPERSDHDQLELARIALRFDRIHYGRLRQLIDALNRCTG